MLDPSGLTNVGKIVSRQFFFFFFFFLLLLSLVQSHLLAIQRYQSHYQLRCVYTSCASSRKRARGRWWRRWWWRREPTRQCAKEVSSLLKWSLGPPEDLLISESVKRLRALIAFDPTRFNVSAYACTRIRQRSRWDSISKWILTWYTGNQPERS